MRSRIVGLFVLGLALATSVAFGQANLNPVPWTQVQIKDSFWKPRQDALISKTLPQQFEQLVVHKYKQNFERAAKRQSGGYVGLVFNDSDVYKVLEAAAFALGIKRDPTIEAKLDEWIELIGRAQEADGYLNTHFQLMEPQNKWKNLRDLHELYCAGHLFEAAAAHYEATGKTTLLNIATKLADHIANRFGPTGKMGYPGHPETELALIKLWKATNNKRYFDLAEFFIQSRGSKFFAEEHKTPVNEYDGRYWSDHKPIREMDSIEGHAVRAAYLFTGVTDYLRFRPDPALQSAVDKVWRSNTERRMFVTGGLGPSGSNEGFTVDYDLPTFTAYQESCASIANALWNYRLALLEGDSKYSDIMETAIYNGAMAGISADGDEYFYVNPLASAGGHHRRPWFECACCPPNLARMIGQIGGLAYATSADAFYVNLFIGGSVKAKVGSQNISFDITTNYPYDGRVNLKYTGKTSATFDLKLRKPSWAESKANGEDGYLTIRSTWRPGDEMAYEVPLKVRRVISNPNVKDTFGMFALARGPLVYCLETVDNKFSFSGIGIPLDQTFTVKSGKAAIQGAPVIEGNVYVYGEQKWKGKLFSEVAPPVAKKFKATPYFLWDNRPQPGLTNEMVVWLSPNPEPAAIRGLESEAKVSVSFRNNTSTPEGATDGFVPESSNPNSPKQLHFWPHKGGQEWVQYTFAAPVTLSGSRIYWFDDTGRGECKVPSGFKMQAKVDGAWKDVELKSGTFGLALDKWNDFQFKAVKATEFRLLITQQDGFASGIHEWQVFED